MEILKSSYNDYDYQIGVDECARGPMFGRLYTSAVILPKNDFDHSLMKDSKKIKKKQKMETLANYIKNNAIAYSVDYIEAYEIDTINIRQAVLKSMKTSIVNVINSLNNDGSIFALIDGNDFTNLENPNTQSPLEYECVTKGDDTYSFIAAASILAKYEHDKYIYDLCEEYPLLNERYDIGNNVGYGTKKHLQGITEYGITQFHRKTYGICKNAKYNPI
jgi:ribonuclease HII